MERNFPMKISILMHNVPRYTGGRYYTWTLAYALRHLDHDVTVYTNQRAGYIMNDLRPRKKPKVKLGLARDIEADLYIGMPIAENNRAVELAAQHGKKALCCIFDSYPALKRTGIQWKELPEKWPELNRDHVWILSLAEANIPDICQWTGARPDRVRVLYPCVNDAALDLKAKVSKDSSIAFISRLVPHKNFAHLMDAAEPLGVRIVAITSDRAEQRNGRVSWYIRVNDRVKFDLLRSARCLCVPSTHEGFGIWAIEAWAAGVPVVCYDLPTIREASAGGTYFAKPGDRWDLQKQLIRCLDEDKRPKPDNRFYFGKMVKGIERILEEVM
jgi:glycosyltransferase involved in cell wall biosynthesis